MEKELVILVDEQDNETGTMAKLEAHQKGLLHRAFSILVINQKNEILLQQRAMGKYHSEGLWTNTCCSHPKPGETIEIAAHRRLQEEMGFDCSLEPAFSFIYKATLENQLLEHELDHVLVGKFEGKPIPNPQEVMNYRWISFKDLKEEIQLIPNNFTYWFKKIVNEYPDVFILKFSK